jgi:hypothetical protein
MCLKGALWFTHFYDYKCKKIVNVIIILVTQWPHNDNNKQFLTVLPLDVWESWLMSSLPLKIGILLYGLNYALILKAKIMNMGSSGPLDSVYKIVYVFKQVYKFELVYSFQGSVLAILTIIAILASSKNFTLILLSHPCLTLHKPTPQGSSRSLFTPVRAWFCVIYWDIKWIRVSLSEVKGLIGNGSTWPLTLLNIP